MSFGINLYSIRNLIANEADFLDTAIRLSEMGYSYMQFSGAPFDADMIKRVSEKSGLPVCLTHVPYDRIVNDTAALMEEHSRFGCRYIGLGAMPLDNIKNEDTFKRTVEELNRAGEKMAEGGFKFLYHHHHFEFFKHGGCTCFDYMIENAPYINFTADTYWLQYGGVDVSATLDRLSGRIPCVHLKDYMIELDAEGRFTPIFAPVGDGNINFPHLLERMKGLGVEYYLVEQDNAAQKPDTLGEVRRSINYLRSL